MSRSPRDAQAAPEVRAVADAVAAVFAGAFDQLADWRSPIEQTLDTTVDMRPAALDGVVADLVLPRLTEPDPLFVGAGVIADGEIVRGRDVHFAWWLGPLDANPVLGSTTEPTRLDLSTRGYTEYLRDFRALEWYRIPATTRDAHVTGPYVDHLCTCDYILTLTMPVHAAIEGHEPARAWSVSSGPTSPCVGSSTNCSPHSSTFPSRSRSSTPRVACCSPPSRHCRSANWPPRAPSPPTAPEPRSGCSSSPRHPCRNKSSAAISLKHERMHRGRRSSGACTREGESP